MSADMSADYIPFDRAFAREFSLQLQVGNASAPDGVTRVRMDGLGNLAAAQYRRAAEATGREQEAAGRQQKEGEDRKEPASDEVKGEVPAEEAARMFDQVSLAPWDTRFPQRPGIPDEAIVEVRLQRAGRESATMKMWLRDAEKDVANGPVLEQLRRRVGELSGGRIYL